MTTNNVTKPDGNRGADGPPAMGQDGVIRVESFDLPMSSLLDAPARAQALRWRQWNGEIARACPGHWADPAAVPALRKFFEERFFPAPLRRLDELYRVRIDPQLIGGVPTEIFTPGEGVSSRNSGRVLINLHGGGFTVGARYGGQLESIPVAALGGLKVVSVDYRMAPEHEFPTATDDVLAVYGELLKQHAPQQIGIYGCSAGALLTAQLVARLQKESLPRPAAIAMLSGSGGFWSEGDSAHFGSVVAGERMQTMNEHPYFRHADASDPLVAQLGSARVLAQFPPALLIAATRDHALSGVVHLHSRLTALGVEARLHVWEGLGHAFFYDPDLPQSREVYDVIVKFFERQLGAPER